MAAILGDRVHRRRLELGLSQPQLAALVGCTQQSISGLEKTQRRSVGYADQLAEALDVNLKWLQGRSEEKTLPVGRRLRRLRNAAGIAVKEAAEALTWSEARYEDYEDTFDGRILPPAIAHHLATLFEARGGNIEALWRLADSFPPTRPPTSTPAAERQETFTAGPTPADAFIARPIDIPQPAELARNLPVLGHAMGGDDGAFEMNGVAHDMVERPPSLARVRNAYAVYMSGTSMEPRLQDGWLLHVHPTKPPTAGSFVVVQIRTGDDTPPLAFVKEFVSRNMGRITCRQYNPPAELTWQAEEVMAVHRVVGIADL